MVRIPTLPTLILLACYIVAPVSSSYAGDRLSLAREMANMTLTMITDQTKNHTTRLEGLKRGFSNVVDTDWIARFVLGANWRKADEKQRTRYTELYKEFLMQTYINTYATDDTQQVTDIRVIDVKDEADNNFTTRTSVELSNGKKLKVDYLVKAEGDEYKIIDVVIEGVSLLSTHRSEFTQVAGQNGVDGVIKKLETLTKVN
ncbi:MAG: phospholipid-binding protein MlaC [Alphaproteobacteria bacterium]